MNFGIALFPDPGCATVVRRAEELGFRSAWFYDSQMLASDVFMCMALAAASTERIRLATGVLIPTNRIAPVAASAFGTLNQMAPGRVVFGVGTGFTGRNTMGQGAQPLADMAEYIRVVRALMAGETVTWQSEGAGHDIRFLHPGHGFVNQDAPVPVHISAFGPRGQALAVKAGDGWITFFGNEAGGIAQAAEMDRRIAEAGKDGGSYEKTAFTLGCVLGEGEAADSPRAMAQAGPIVAVGWHGVMERWEALPDVARAAFAPMRALYETYSPENARYLQLHTGHLLYVRDDERSFITADAIKRQSFTGTREELRDRVRAIKAAGYNEFVVQLVKGQEQAVEDWAGVFDLV
ncbi:hypothetical protein AYO38_01035 [bacterium SCGC AG-212-C10]|nr:hypothetical protein AYO38_01035 [bacterium SCGC AG-212-C10]